MQLVQRRFPGIVMLVRVNMDRLASAAMVVLGLLAGAFIADALMLRF